MRVKTCFWQDIRRCIEAVITSTIGNRVVLNGARGFKSHSLRFSLNLIYLLEMFKNPLKTKVLGHFLLQKQIIGQ